MANITMEQVAQFIARAQAAGVSMEQLMNGTDSQPTPKAEATTPQKREGIYWMEKTGKSNDGKDWVSFQVVRDYVSRGEVKQDRILSAGPMGWTRLFGLDNDGDSILMSALSFLQDHSEDFVSVTKTVDKFVMAYLMFRADLFETDNSDLLGASTPKGGEEVQEEVIDPREVILTSPEFVKLCGPGAFGLALQEAIYDDFLASGASTEDYLANIAEFEGDVFAFLAEVGYPDADGKLVPHPENAPAATASRPPRPGRP